MGCSGSKKPDAKPLLDEADVIVQGLPPPPDGDFKVFLKHTHGMASLGLLANPKTDYIYVQTVHEGGLVQTWNDDHENQPELQIVRGDQIICVNGVSGKSELMLLAGKYAASITLTVNRGQKRKEAPEPRKSEKRPFREFSQNNNIALEEPPPHSEAAAAVVFQNPCNLPLQAETPEAAAAAAEKVRATEQAPYKLAEELAPNIPSGGFMHANLGGEEEHVELMAMISELKEGRSASFREIHGGKDNTLVLQVHADDGLDASNGGRLVLCTFCT